MTTENKQLLLKDLCARLPYRVIAYASEINKNGIITDVNVPYNMVNLTVDNESGKYELVPLFDIKPYLRPMSSMTEEEKKVFDDFVCIDEFAWNGNAEKGYPNQAAIMSDGIDWLLEHHFDFRGLIKKELALEAPEGMYKRGVANEQLC